jgi:hypothetical protein
VNRLNSDPLPIFMHYMKAFGGLFLMLAGMAAFLLYLSGSHGHFRFRMDRAADWIFYSLFLLLPTAGLYLIVRSFRKHRSRS